MPTFDTPEPISVTLEFDVGSARFVAGKRTDTVVEVLPSSGAESADVKAAQQTKVTFSGGRLLIKGSRQRTLFARAGSIDVTVELPSGSDLQADSPLADFVCEGEFGDCRLKTSLGDIQLDTATNVNLRADRGEIRVDRVTGDAEVSGAGRVEVGKVTGTAAVKNLNGETAIAEVSGDLRVNASNGRTTIGLAGGRVDAKSASGAIRIGEVVHGEVVLLTSIGDVEVGIGPSTAAYLDVHTRVGSVRNSLGAVEGPGDAARTVEVRARTQVGDIVVRRAAPRDH